MDVKHVFYYSDDLTEIVHTVKGGGERWTTLVEEFVSFLKGCGYQITHQDVAAYFQELYGDVNNDFNEQEK